MNITMMEAAKAWGEGKDVEWMSSYETGIGWRLIGKDAFCFNNHIQYRLKPEVTTSLTVQELRQAYYSKSPWPNCGAKPPQEGGWFQEALRSVADTAIRQYIKEQTK